MSVEPPWGTFDVVVIGGGITGASVARDAALRGLTCLLLEKGDFSSGTSSRTSRFIHGGLSYLETGEFQLALENLVERDILLRLAPHLVHPLEVLLPFYRGDARSRWKLRAGLRAYELVSLGRAGAPHLVSGSRPVLERVAYLPEQGLVGAAWLQEHQMPVPERLVLENVFSAREQGAWCLNYHEAVGIEAGTEGLTVRVRDRLDGAEHAAHGRVVVNAAGPWADRVGGLLSEALPPKVLAYKGTHLLLKGGIDPALLLACRTDRRLFFSLPLGGFTLLGLARSEWRGDPDEVRPEPEEERLLLGRLRDLVPGLAGRERDALWSYSGVHAPSRASARRHSLHAEGPEGRLLTVVGGNFTTARKRAEETVDRACGTLRHGVPCSTDRVPFFGGGFPDRVLLRENLWECTKRLPNLPREQLEHLVTLYGRRCWEVVSVGLEREEWTQPIAPGHLDSRAQVIYAVRAEDAHRLDDVIFRRLRAGLSADRGLSAAPEVARLMGRELGWDAATERRELEAFREVARVGSFHPTREEQP